MAFLGSIIGLLSLGLMIYGLAKVVFGFGPPVQVKQRTPLAASQHRNSGMPIQVTIGVMILFVILLIIGLLNRQAGEVIAFVAILVGGTALMVGWVACFWGGMRLSQTVSGVDALFYVVPSVLIPIVGGVTWIYYGRKYPHVLGYVGTTASSSFALLWLCGIVGIIVGLSHIDGNEKADTQAATPLVDPVPNAPERAALDIRTTPRFEPPPLPTQTVTVSPPVEAEDRTAHQWAIDLTSSMRRSRAVVELRKIGAEAEAPTLRYATHPDFRTRQAVAQVLAEVGTEQSIPALRKMVGDDHSTVASEAEKALKRIDPAAARGVLIHVMKLQSSQWQQTLIALRAIAAAPVQPEHHDAVAAALEENASSTSRAYRDELIDALVKWKRDESLPVLIAMASDSTMRTSQKKLLLAIAEYRTDEAAAALVNRLGDRATRREAAEALVVMGDFAESHVAALLTDSDDNLRSDAIELLGKIGTTKSASALTRVVRDRRNRTLSRRANDALDEIRDRANEARRLEAQQDKEAVTQ